MENSDHKANNAITILFVVVNFSQQWRKTGIRNVSNVRCPNAMPDLKLSDISRTKEWPTAKNATRQKLRTPAANADSKLLAYVQKKMKNPD